MAHVRLRRNFGLKVCGSRRKPSPTPSVSSATHAAKTEPTADAESSAFDPERFLFEIAGALHAAADQDELDAAWRTIVTPHAGKISEETLSIAMRLYSLNSSVLTLKGARYE